MKLLVCEHFPKLDSFSRTSEHNGRCFLGGSNRIKGRRKRTSLFYIYKLCCKQYANLAHLYFGRFMRDHTLGTGHSNVSRRAVAKHSLQDTVSSHTRVYTLGRSPTGVRRRHVRRHSRLLVTSKNMFARILVMPSFKL